MSRANHLAQESPLLVTEIAEFRDSSPNLLACLHERRGAGSLHRRRESPAWVSGTGESDSFVDAPLKNLAPKHVRSRQ